MTTGAVRAIGTSRMTIDVVVVTPAMAEKWLESNTHNRPISDGLVERYASDMRTGQWKLTHQGIAFDEAGALADGQHRLWAILKSGVSVKMAVSRNVPADALGNIDGHRVRSVGDNLGLIDGVRNAKQITSRAVIISQIERVVAGEARIGNTPALSIATTRDIYARHREGLDWSGTVLPIGKSFAVAPFAGALAWCWPTNPKAINDFAVAVRHGEGIRKGDPAYTMRDFLLVNTGNSGAGHRWITVLATLRTALAFCKGEKLHVIKQHYLLNPGENTPMALVDEAFGYFAKAHAAGAP